MLGRALTPALELVWHNGRVMVMHGRVDGVVRMSIICVGPRGGDRHSRRRGIE